MYLLVIIKGMSGTWDLTNKYICCGLKRKKKEKKKIRLGSRTRKRRRRKIGLWEKEEK